MLHCESRTDYFRSANALIRYLVGLIAVVIVAIVFLPKYILIIANERILIVRKALALAVLFVAIQAGGCSLLSHQAPTEDVDKAAGLFFQRLDNQDFNGIYDDCSKRFKTNKPRQTILQSLAELAANGKTQNFQRTKMSIDSEGKNRVVTPVYQVLFDQTPGEITLNFQDESGEWKLLGFAFKPRRQ